MLIVRQFILARYIKLYLLVLFTLAILLWLTQVISIIEFLALKGLNFFDFLTFSLLLLPRVIEGVIPLVGVVVSVVLSLDLIGKRELFVLKSSGLSVQDIAKPVVLLGYAIFAFSLLIQFVISPLAYSKYVETKTSIRESSFSFSFHKNSVMQLGSDTILYSEKEGDRNSNIVLYKFDEEKETISYAKDGDLIKLKDEILINLEDGGVYSRDNKKGNFNTLTFDRFTTGIEIKNIAKRSDQKDRNKAYTGLMIVNSVLKEGSKDMGVMAELFRRISWSLLGFLLPILVFKICISGDFNRRYGIKRRILFSCVLTIIIVSVHFLLKHNFTNTTNITTYVIAFFIFIFALWKIDIENNFILSKRLRHKTN